MKLLAVIDCCNLELRLQRIKGILLFVYIMNDCIYPKTKPEQKYNALETP